MFLIILFLKIWYAFHQKAEYTDKKQELDTQFNPEFHRLIPKYIINFIHSTIANYYFQLLLCIIYENYENYVIWWISFFSVFTYTKAFLLIIFMFIYRIRIGRYQVSRNECLDDFQDFDFSRFLIFDTKILKFRHTRDLKLDWRSHIFLHRITLHFYTSKTQIK